MLIKRLLPLLLLILTFSLFEVFFYFPDMIYVCLVLVALAVFFSVWRLTMDSKKAHDWWNFLILPLSFIISSAAFITLLSQRMLIQSIIVLTAVFVYFYIRTVYNFLYKTAYYKNLSLENISSYGNFITFFFISATVFGLQSFLNVSVYFTILMVMVSSFLVIYQIMWVNRIDSKEKYVYLVLSSFVLVELSWAISYLPSKYIVSGFVLSVCYYMLIGLVRFHLLRKLNAKTLKHYLGFGLTSILIVLLTARWL